MWLVELDPELKNKTISDIKHIDLFSSKLITNELVQCHRCQQFGPTRTYCNRSYRRVKCVKLITLLLNTEKLLILHIVVIIVSQVTLPSKNVVEFTKIWYRTELIGKNSYQIRKQNVSMHHIKSSRLDRLKKIMVVQNNFIYQSLNLSYLGLILLRNCSKQKR